MGDRRRVQERNLPQDEDVGWPGMDDFREHGLFLMYDVCIFTALWSAELRMQCTLNNKFENSTDFCNITVVDLKMDVLFLF